MKKNWIKKALMIIFFVAVAVLAFGFLVMTLWNNLLPEILGVQTISFVQALGILLLSKILFGGFGGRGHSGYRKKKWMDMKQKFSGMSVEEREKFKAEWKHRCGAGWRTASPAAQSSEKGDFESGNNTNS